MVPYRGKGLPNVPGFFCFVFYKMDSGESNSNFHDCTCIVGKHLPTDCPWPHILGSVESILFP